MTVEQLIENLKAFPPHLEVVMSKDGEGNNYSLLSGFSIGLYEPDSTWSGEFSSYWDLEDMNEPEQFRDENNSNAICLWPVN